MQVKYSQVRSAKNKILLISEHIVLQLKLIRSN